MPRPREADARAMRSLVLTPLQSSRAFDERQYEMGFIEIMQQFQLQIAGQTGTTWGFAEAPLAFDYPFYFAPGQRDPDFVYPHFWYGSEITPGQVAVTCCVSQWNEDPDNGAIIGCNVTIGTMGAMPAIYKGAVHMTFQGFAALEEDSPDVG